VNEMEELIEQHNKFSDKHMEIWPLTREFFRLVVEGVELTDGDSIDIIERVKGINRENGYTHI